MATHRMVKQARLIASVGIVAMLLSACVTVPPPEPEPYREPAVEAAPDVRVVPPPLPPYASPPPRDTRPAGPPMVRNAPPPPAYGNAPAYDSAAYLWIDDADAFVEAVGDAPPDFTFQVDRSPVWAWVGSYGDTMLVGRTARGNVEYHFSPRARVPYFVRDADYAFAFDDDRIVAAYNRDGRVLRGALGRQLEDLAWAMHERGRVLLTASDNRRWDGDAARVWIDVSPTIFLDRRVWQDRWLRDRVEDGRHRTNREDRRRRWQNDRADRANAADRFRRWSREGGHEGNHDGRRGGPRVAPPGALQPMPGGGAMVPGSGPNRPDRPNRPQPALPGAGGAPTAPVAVAPLPATPVITPPASAPPPRGPQRPRPIPNEPGELERMVPREQPTIRVRDVPTRDPAIATPQTETPQIEEQRNAAAERAYQAAQQQRQADQLAAERQRQAAQQAAERQRQAASENAERERQAANENAERQRAAQQAEAQQAAAMRQEQAAQQQQAMQAQQQAAQEQQQRQQAAAQAAERRAAAAADAAAQAARAAAEAAANSRPERQDERRGVDDNERPD